MGDFCNPCNPCNPCSNNHQCGWLGGNYIWVIIAIIVIIWLFGGSNCNNDCC